VKDFVAWLMGARWRAIVLAALLGLVSWLQPFSGGVVALVALRLGWLEGAVVAAGASLLALLAGWLSGVGPVFALSPLLGVWLPALALALVLRRSHSLALMIQVATGVAIAGLAAYYIIVDEPVAPVQAWLQANLVPLMTRIGGEAAVPSADRLEAMARLTPGMLAAGMILFATLAVLIGRWWQAALANPGGFRHDFHRLTNGRVATLAASVLFVGALLTSNLWLDNAALALLVMFMYQGLAVLHGVIGMRRMHRGWLVAVYSLMVLVPLQLVSVAAIVGLLDNWLHFRRLVAANVK
jgi:hypothetical protein